MIDLDEVVDPAYRHSYEQISQIEKLCQKGLNDKSLNIRSGLELLPELAQHGSAVFTDLADYLGQTTNDERLNNFLSHHALVYQHVACLLRPTRSIFKNDARVKLYDQSAPVYYKGPKNNNPFLVFFTTSYNNFYISNLALAESLAQEGFSFLIVKDPSGMQYTQGIANISSSWEDSINWLRKFIRQNAEKRSIVFSGFSSSGFYAILAALACNSDYTVSFSPKSTMKEDKGTVPSKVMTRKMYDSIPSFLKCDLVEQVSLYSTPVSIFVGQDSSIDLRHADRLNEVPSVTVEKIANTGHISLLPLFIEGNFTKVFFQ